MKALVTRGPGAHSKDQTALWGRPPWGSEEPQGAGTSAKYRSQEAISGNLTNAVVYWASITFTDRGSLTHGISWKLEVVMMVRDLSSTWPICHENTGGSTGTQHSGSQMRWSGQQSNSHRVTELEQQLCEEQHLGQKPQAPSQWTKLKSNYRLSFMLWRIYMCQSYGGKNVSFW